MVRSYVDQLERSGEIDGRSPGVRRLVNLAERFNDRGQESAARAALRILARGLRGEEFRELREAVRDLADSLRR